MHRRYRHALLVALGLLTLGALPDVGLGVSWLVAEGPAHQFLDERAGGVHSDCDADGRASLSWTSGPPRLLVTVEPVGCLPTFSLISACGQLLSDGTFHCQRGASDGFLNVTLTPAGVFDFYWETATFTEHDTGVLVRLQEGSAL